MSQDDAIPPAGAGTDSANNMTDSPDDRVIGEEGETNGWGGMEQPIPDQPAPSASTRAKAVRPEAARCSACCGCLFFLTVLILSAGGYLLYDYRMAHADPLVNDFREKGYEVIRGEVLNIDKPLERNTLFLARQVNFNADQKVDLAVRAPVCDIAGRIAGKLFFEGKLITIKTGASVQELNGTAETLSLIGELLLNHLQATTVKRQ